MFGRWKILDWETMILMFGYAINKRRMKGNMILGINFSSLFCKTFPRGGGGGGGDRKSE